MGFLIGFSIIAGALYFFFTTAPTWIIAIVVIWMILGIMGNLGANK